MVNSGVESDTGLDHNLKIINVISLIGALFVSFYLFGSLFLSLSVSDIYWKVFISETFLFPFFLTPLLFTARKKRIAAAINISIIGLCATVVAPILIFGQSAGIHFFTIAFPALIVLIFNKKQDLFYFIFFSLLCIIGFVYCEFYLERALIFTFPPDFPMVYLRINNSISTILLVAISVYVFSNDLNFARNKISEEHERANNLLLNILPGPIAERLKNDEKSIADGFAHATILFADIVDFTQIAARYKPENLVNLLNNFFSAYDLLTEKYGLEKIKTIGDAYMVAAGIPNANPKHAQIMAAFALDMVDITHHISKEINEKIVLRVGINSGPVTAGVIGKKKFIYDLWGDAVNLASRMESSGLPGKIQVTEDTYQLLKDDYLFTQREPVEIKGKGLLKPYILIGPKKNNY